MKKLLWSCLCGGLVGCHLSAPVLPTRPSTGNPPPTLQMPSTPTAKVYPDPSGAPLPSSGYSYLVVSHCPSSGCFMAEGVDVEGNKIAFLVVGSDSEATTRFFSEAYLKGVPITVYTAPMRVGANEDSTAAASSQEQTYYPCAFRSQVVDPTEDPPLPTGNERCPQNPDEIDSQVLESFTKLAVKTARAARLVATPAPAPTPQPQ